jgi:C4-dicarboxylate-specific signal transduction histidine kinase
MPQNRTIVLCLLGISVLPFIIFAWFLFSYGSNQYEDFLKRRVISINEMFAEKVQKNNEHLLAEATAVSVAPQTIALTPILLQHAGTSGDAEYRAAYEDLLSALATVSCTDEYDVSIYSPKGILAATTSLADQQNVGTLAQADEKRTVDEGIKGSYLSPILQHGDTPDENIMYIAKTIVGSDTTILGVVVFRVPMEAIYDDLKSAQKISETGETYIVQDDGSSVLFLSPLKKDENAPLVRRVSYGEKKAEPAQFAAKGGYGYGRAVDYDNETVAAAWKYLPDVHWGIVTQIDMSEAFGHIKNVQRSIAVVGAAFLLLSVIASLLLTEKVIVAPLKKISAIAEDLSIGKEPTIHKKDLYAHHLVGTVITHLHNISNRVQQLQKDNKEDKDDLIHHDHPHA